MSNYFFSSTLEKISNNSNKNYNLEILKMAVDRESKTDKYI